MCKLVHQRSQKSFGLDHVVAQRRARPEHDAWRVGIEDAVQLATSIARPHAFDFDWHAAHAEQPA